MWKTVELSGIAGTMGVPEDTLPQTCWRPVDLHVLLILTSLTSFTRPKTRQIPGALQGHLLSQNPEGSISTDPLDTLRLPTLI